ncbi:uncharacterized protein PAC_03669 [Phialocephala subalpina]|uniref:Nuclear RNA binding protein n=1 Tax=Phialocephala subalpina TaxID=576137 RepID=A0A1L7WLY1_9HELO|nr:uncharacterized protein PAC_03669 [Phialocephala subalpina]
MSTVYQQTGDRGRPATQAKSPRDEDYDDTTPKAGTKRLFSNRVSRQIEGKDYNGEYEDLEPVEERHSDKRHRSADWPLPPSSPASPASARPPLRNRNAPNSPSSRTRRAVSQQRPSKFQEGSMNDRVSQVPPIPYLDGEDELLEEYDPIEPRESRGRNIARPRVFTRRNESVAGSVTDQSETSRHSIFRFGKSIAASFNPSNWKIWSKGQHSHENEETAQMRVLRERQSKAERIYRELKESGRFGNSNITFPNPSVVQGEPKPKHDSGIEFGENDIASNQGNNATPLEEKRKGRIYLEPPRLSESVHGGSPVSHMSSSQANSNNSSPNKSSFHFKKPSLSNLKKSFASLSSTNLSEPGQQARRIPSRKDLQKQQKLVKRVSDLEGKLQAARKQLSDAMGEPLPLSQVSLSSQGSHVIETSEVLSPPVPPVHHTPMGRVTRRPFVPGALASLPSERLLPGYKPDEEDEEEEDEEEEGDIKIGMAVSVDHKQAVMSEAVTDEKSKKTSISYGQSPAWLGRQLQRPGGSSEAHSKQGVKDEDEATPTVKKSLPTNKLDVADTSAIISMPVAQAVDNTVRDFAEVDSAVKEEEEDKEKTPKSQSQLTPGSKKRKSKFVGHADDGGIYVPTEGESGSDPESEVKKYSPQKQQSTARNPESTPRHNGRRLILNSPRKLQKISPSQTKAAATNVPPPPRRAPPPPPTDVPSQPEFADSPSKRAPPPPSIQGPSPVSQSSAASTIPARHPERTSSLKSTMKSPPPPSRVGKWHPPPLPTARQQSASPPPSSAFTGVGAELEYKKPSLHRPKQNEGQAYAADPAEDEGIPAMPKMPNTVRLASGEVVNTQVPASKPITKGILKNGRGRAKAEGSMVSRASGVSKSSTNKLVKGRRESTRLEKKRVEIETGMEKEKEGKMVRDASFEWPEDCF